MIYLLGKWYAKYTDLLLQSIKVIAILVFLLFTYNVYAIELIDLSNVQTIEGLGRKLQYFKDEQHRFSAFEIINLNQNSWNNIDEEVPNFGFDDSSFWLQLKLKNSSSETIDKYITIDYPLLDHVDLFVYQDRTLVNEIKSGDNLKFDQRPIKNRNFIFPIKISANQQITVLLNIKSEGAIQVPISMLDPVEFDNVNSLDLIIQSLFIGAMFAVAIYNFILFIFIRESSYIYYVAYILSYCLFHLTIRGLSFRLIWPNGIGLNEKMLGISLCAIICFAILFSIKFLNLKYVHKACYFILLFIFCTAFTLFISLFFVHYSFVIQTLVILIITGSVIIFGAGISQWLKGNQSAKIYSIAWAAFWIGASLNGLNKFGFLPRTFFTEYATLIGTIIEVFLLSLALAERINAEKRNNLQLKEIALKHEKKALEIQVKANEELEERVQSRTRDLEKAMNELSVVNVELNNLRTVDSLTQIKNRAFFDETIYKEWRRASRSDVSLSLVIVDIDFFKKINDTYGHLAGDEALKQIAQILSLAINRSSDTLARYGGEEFIIILPHTNYDGAMKLAEKIRLTCEQSVLRSRNAEFSVTVSIGVSSVEDVLEKELEISDLIDSADKALYRSKENGRNQVNGEII